MGSSSGGKKKYVNFRNRQRASLSFFIVVMFFGVFGIIVFTEIFFIDERGRAAGVVVRRGSLTIRNQDKGTDYDDGFQSEDYISIRVGAAMMNDDTLGALLIGGRPPVALPVVEQSAPSAPKVFSEKHLPPFPENTSLNEGSWQDVKNTKYKFYVFSAFYDVRKGQRIVRVIGATKTRGSERVWCRLWYKAGESNSTAHLSVTVPAKTKVIRENWNLKYSACFVLCALKNKSIPVAVSIVARIIDSPANLLAVINNRNETSLPSGTSVGGSGTGAALYKFGVCVKPIHFQHNRALQIMEFIEFNRILGVEHFTFYNDTIGSQVDCILKDYIEKGLVTVLPWKLNMVSQKDIRTEGLFAALNDCLYRSMYKYSHVLLIDLDEYILPKYNDTLGQMVDYLNRRFNFRTTGSYSFQNAFFYLQWSDDDSVYDLDDPVAANLITLKKTRRKTKLHPHKQRSKYICRPETILEAGNHFVWEFVPGHGTLNVPADTAILHHYRICEFGGDDCVRDSSTVDRTAYRFKSALTGAVRVGYNRLKKKCVLPELTLPSGKVFDKLMHFLKPNLDS